MMKRGVTAVVVAGLLATAACGSALSDTEVLRRNGVTADDRELTVNLEDPTEPSSQLATPDSATGIGNSVAADPASAGTVAPVGTGPARAITTPGETGPIVIGSVGNYSGPAGAAQAGLPRAVQVWAAAVNSRGGLFGRQVKVIVQDDGGDPARYASAVQDLVENRGVIAFVGQGAVLSLRGGLDYLAAKGIPVIGNDCSTPDWYKPSTNNFPQCATTEAQIATYVYAGVRLTGKKRLGYVFCGETPTCTLNAPVFSSPAMARTGAQTVYGAQISVAQIDFTANCQAAQRAQVEIMVVVADPGTLGRIVRACDRQAFTPQYIGFSISVLRDTVRLPGLGRVVAGTPTFPFDGASTPAINEFLEAMAQFGTSPAGPAESAGWAAAKLFELAATRAAETTGSLNPASLIAALRTVKGETLGGLTVPLDLTKPTPNPQPCAFVMQGNGEGGWAAPLGPEPLCAP